MIDTFRSALADCTSTGKTLMKIQNHAIWIAAASLLLVSAGSAEAQATRTWVSGVGDDANPCSRTAPCKTFAGAISKTATGGEVNVLDPGGFGGVTITKSITIANDGVGTAGVLVSGTNGVIVNVPNATDVVVLKGLDFQGLNTGLSGVTVITGGTVQIENCIIDSFTTGINFTPTVAGSQLHVLDTIIRNNGTGSTGGGILVSPSAAATANVNRCRMEDNVFGLKALGASTTSVSESAAVANGFAGFSAAGAPAILTVERSVSTRNGTGIRCDSGTTVRLGNNSITDNSTTFGGTGTPLSFRNNDIDVTVTTTPVSQQ